MRVKICGIRDTAARDAAVEAGASYLGFVFVPRSPRNISIDQGAALAASTPSGICKVCLLVDPDDALLHSLLSAVPIDMIQLHGKESPERLAAIRQQTGLPVMKALGIADGSDLAQLDRYSGVADQILVDAKPPQAGDLPGGNGLAFDWRLLAGRRWPQPWMLAGGLTADNVIEAANLTGATQVDVSSGVETSPGVKNPDKIRAFLCASGASRQSMSPA